jgi:hypothetical protein
VDSQRTKLILPVYIALSGLAETFSEHRYK